jgi:hypothetical protein
MDNTLTLPSIEALKNHARRLRAKLRSDENEISHSRSLEMLAHQFGYRDWNTLHAAAGNGPPVGPVPLDQRCAGVT